MPCRTLRSLPLLLLLGLLSCKKEVAKSPQVDPRHLRIDPAKVVVQAGEVGVPPAARQATYVLCDVKNNFTSDAMVTVGGTLRDAAGKPVGKLRLQSLRVPSGGTRMFALVGDQNQLRPDAAGADLQIVSATPVTYSPEVIVSEGRVVTDQGRAVVLGAVENTAAVEGVAVVIAGFYDGDGKPMARPSTSFQLAAKGKRGVQFVGPPGSTQAYLFIGETVF